MLCIKLCLVRVKAFSENIPFFENAIFRKGKYFHVFGYISKNFLKNIFWCLEKKKEKTNQTNPEEGRRDSTAIVEIAINGAIASLVDRRAVQSRRRSQSIATSDDDRRSRSTSVLVGRSHRSSIAPLVNRRARSSNDRAAHRSVLSDLGSLSLSLSLSLRK